MPLSLSKVRSFLFTCVCLASPYTLPFLYTCSNGSEIRENYARFHWLVIGDSSRDYLVSWEVCCKRNRKGGSALVIWCLKGKALAAKWLWHFPLQHTSSWHQVFQGKYGLHSNGWDTNFASRVSHTSPWKFIS